MSLVLAALDCSPAARPVLEAAIRTGQLTGNDVEAVHILDGPAESVEILEALATKEAVPLRLLEGPVEPALFAALNAPDVTVAVIGARGTIGGRRPVGRTTLHVLHHLGKPVVVVPPEAVSPAAFRTLLVPLEGTDATSRPVLEQLLPLMVDEVELVVLHVFTAATLPTMLDHPLRDLEILGKEFLDRHCPFRADVEFRPGPVTSRVVEVADERNADLVVLSWYRDSSPGRASIIRGVLGTSRLPVLLLPVTGLDQPVPSAGN